MDYTKFTPFKSIGKYHFGHFRHSVTKVKKRGKNKAGRRATTKAAPQPAFESQMAIFSCYFTRIFCPG